MSSQEPRLLHSSPVGGGGGSNVETEAERLFVDRTVSEIRQIEQKTRLDIERKKEELRQLVGERYHDMIESADSVVAMRQSTLDVIHSLGRVKESCQQTQQMHFLKGTGGQQAPPIVSSAQSIVAQMRLLMELQEMTWRELDEGHYLMAGGKYLLMQYVISRLRTVCVSWPYLLLQLWQQMIEMDRVIVKNCHNYLQSVHLEETRTAECCIVLLLLEKCSLSQLLHWLLENRQVAIKGFSHSSHSKSVKLAIKELFQALCDTVAVIASLFTETSKGSSRLLEQLNRFINSSEASFSKGLIGSHGFTDSLPDYITGYRPQLNTLDPLDSITISNSVSQWIDQCVTTVHSGVQQLLSHVSSLKGLALVRQTVHSLLSTYPSSDSDGTPSLVSVKSEWSKKCHNVLGEDIVLYDRFLQPVLLKRAKEIIQSLMSEIDSQSVDLLHRLVKHHETTPDAFLPDTDLTSHLWTTADEQQLESGENGGTASMLLSLKMKSHCCTPQIYNFCLAFSGQLQALIEDVQAFSAPPLLTHYQELNITESYPFNWRADLVSVNEYVMEDLVSCIQKFLLKVESIATPLAAELKNNQHTANLLAERIVLLARLCQCLITFTPNLNVLIEGISHISSSTRSKATHSSKSNTYSHKISISLQQKANELYRMWCHWLSTVLASQLNHSLHSELDTVTLAGLMNWDEISITEETEKGQRLSSIIHVPSQASLFLSTTLFALCQEITRAGGSQIDRTILQELTREVFQVILTAYSELLISSNKSTLATQEYALQTLYDLQFSASVLGSSGWQDEWPSLNQQYSVLCSSLKEIIDPFDYDVFYPYLMRALDRQLQRSTVMLGQLISLRGYPHTQSKYHTSLPSSSSEAYQEKHIVLPLSTQLPRLSALPSGGGSTSGLQPVQVGSLHHQWLESRRDDYHVPSFQNLTNALQRVY